MKNIIDLASFDLEIKPSVEVLIGLKHPKALNKTKEFKETRLEIFKLIPDFRAAHYHECLSPLSGNQIFSEVN